MPRPLSYRDIPIRKWGKEHARSDMNWLRRNWMNLLLAVVLFTGAGLLSYPTASNLWNTWHQSRAIRDYDAAVRTLSVQDYTAELEAARRYNAELAGHAGRWDADGEFYSRYEGLLDVGGDGIMCYVEIPAINVKLPVYHGTDDNVLQVAVGHLYGSSLPVGGAGTHAVLSGHTGLPRAELFTGLTELEAGDEFMIRVLDELLTYEIDQIRVVLPDDVSDLKIDPEQDYCTLVTCTPYGVNSHRLLVRGVRIENAAGTEEPEIRETHADTRTGVTMKQVALLIGPSLAAAFVLFLALRAQRKTKKAR